MSLVQINHNPSRRQLASFGLIWLVFFVALGAMLAARGGLRPAVWILWIVAAAAVPGWMAPRWMRLLYLGMSYLSLPIGFVVSHVIVAAVWYLVFTPIGLLLRAVGYDPLARKFDPQAKTYWVPRGAEPPVERYFRQY
jgi:hypothetical protein